MATTTDNWAEKIGGPAFEAIREMVEALQVDWERLDELRDELAEWEGPENWADANPDDAELAERLEAAAGDCENEDDARQRIDEDSLSIELGGWWTPGSEPEPTEYRILLGTGGPAVRIVGDLDRGNEPASAVLEVQDWFKPWTEYRSADRDDDEILLAYVQCFSFED